MTSFLGYDMEPGLVPLVVGVVSTPEGLEKAAQASRWPCDVVEIRLDLIGDDVPDWPVFARRLTKAGIGTLLTVRHPAEGGRWLGDEASRLDAYVQGLPHVTGIDIELDAEIFPDVLALAKTKVTVIGSHHQFRLMPDDLTLKAVVEKGRVAGVDVVKIAAFAGEQAELTRLRNLLENHPRVPVCALAMGPMGPESRITLPLAGSCLSYGFLDKPNAPGQPSAEDIRAQLMEAHEEYRTFVDVRTALEAAE
ncbi:MAG TPA: type I 3-dehydroquinate dehydratase [Kiritimatiellia bacterium]|nr:type I 3-dehydroquinate dehydratase [Kiritimatiellia bacterium]HMP00700.1 type I 3-dehydroquinate dehydratase [Kiritimatiellia bacterium]HMP97942.1 type I 3-dehydroquinate dehydratase [Kiritimatiellia bacterium]